MKDRILILGAGMVAHYLRPLHNSPHELHFASRSEKPDWENHHIVDICDPPSLRSTIEEVNSDVVINAAVFGNIQACESNPTEADRVNHQGQRNVIEVCNDLGIKLVYISTNSVFCGRTGYYTEDHIPHPGTEYGRSKLRGEETTRQVSNDWAIFRITAIFGDYPGTMDFLQKAISVLKDGGTMPCWDQRVTPTYGPFLAETIMELIERGVEGVWHVAGNEGLARYEIGDMVQKQIGSGSIEQIPTPAGLPLDRTLSTDKLRSVFPHMNGPTFERSVERMVNDRL